MNDMVPNIAEKKARGWDWVVSELRRVRDEMRAERERLLGPDRGE